MSGTLEKGDLIVNSKVDDVISYEKGLTELRNKYGEENTYKIILQCYYPYEPQFVEFLFGMGPDDELYFYDFEITAQNGKITEKQMSDMW